MSCEARIVATSATPYARHAKPGITTIDLLAEAFVSVLGAAGLSARDVDGLAVASFTLPPDHAIDVAWRFGVRARWLMDDANGGASAISMLQHAVRAIEAGDASNIVLLAGDHFGPNAFATLSRGVNRLTAEWLAPIPTGGPNAQFALLTQRHAAKHGLEPADYAAIPLLQRSWASLNPEAVYKDELTLEQYLAASSVAPPLCRYDCPPVVSGADAIVISGAGESGVAIRSLELVFNHDGQRGDGLETGLRAVADSIWSRAGCRPGDVDVLSIYDDYPVMVLVQLDELGFIPDGDLMTFLRSDGVRNRTLPLNTSGGQLSAGQAGAAGGMHGLGEAVRQLQGLAGRRQVDRARRALVSGYGMVLYGYGACVGATVLEAVR